MVEEYIWDRTGGVKRGIIIRGQVFLVYLRSRQIFPTPA